MQNSIHFFARLFNIRVSEWPRVLFLCSIVALANIGVIWGKASVYAAFLKEAGLEALPWVMVFSAILSVIAISIYTAFVDRITNNTLLIAIYILGAVSIIIGLGLIWLGWSLYAYPLLYTSLLAWLAVESPHTITYINSFYDTQSAKRILPVVSAGSRLGGVIGGLSMPFLTFWFNTNIIIVIWFLIYLIIIGLVWFVPRFLKEERPVGHQSTPTSPDKATFEKQRSPYIDNIREGFNYTVQSTFLRWMAIGTLVLMILVTVIEYKSSEILLDIYKTPEELANFLAVLVGVANLVILPILLFVMSRIIARFGVGNISLIYPVSNLVISFGIIAFPGWITAAAGYLNRNTLRNTFQSAIDSLLYNAVSLRVKGRARAFVSGLIIPIGSVLGGLLLLLPLVTTVKWFVPTLIGALAIAYSISAWFIRQQYSRALVKMLEQENYSFLFSQEASTLSAADPATLKLLQERLEESNDPEFIVFMAQIIAQVGGSKAVSILSSVATDTTDASTRAAVVDVLAAANIHGDVVRQLYIDCLADPDGQVRQSALAGLESLVGVDDEQFQTAALQMLNDPDIELRTQTLLALTHSINFYALAPAVNALNQILAEEDPQKRVRGVLVQGEIARVYTSRNLSGVTRPVYSLTTHLFDSADQVRLQTVLGIERVSENKVTDKLAELILQQVSSVTKDPVERIRQATLVVYGRLGKREAHPILVDALTDISPQVRSAAVEMMVQIGKSVIPTIHPMLDSADVNLCKTITMVLCRIDRNEYSGLISSHVTNNLLIIYHNYGYLAALSRYKAYISITVLQAIIQEQNHRLLDEIFRLLSALHKPDTIQIITESLHNKNTLVRANAVEALEALTSPQTAKLIGPLYDPKVKTNDLLRLSEETWEMDHPDSDKIIEIFSKSEDDWLRAIIIFALGEISGATAQKTAVRRANKQKPKERRLQSTALFDTLEDTSNNIKEETPQKKLRKRPSDILNLFDNNSQTKEHKSSRRKRLAVDPLAALAGKPKSVSQAAKTSPANPQTSSLLSPGIGASVNAIIEDAVDDDDVEVRKAARSAKRMMAGLHIVDLHLAAHAANRIVSDSQTETVIDEEEFMLSTIEKIIFLKKVPFFQGMTIDQLKTLANVCDEELFEEDTRIFNEGERGGTLYVVISGKVAIEKEGKRKGSFARLSTLDAHSYFGEMNLFDNSANANSAIAIQDTLTLRLRREPLIALARQYPDLSLELINVLSQRLRDVNDQVVELTRTKPRELHKLFDQFD